jgi:hypothetical protein
MSTTAAPSGAHGAAEALTLLDAPAAAALVIGALERVEDRKALRLTHPLLRDAVGEATRKLQADFTPHYRGGDRRAVAAARPPTARCWPRLEALAIGGLDLEALGSDTWASLRSLNLRVLYSFGYYGLDFARDLPGAPPAPKIAPKHPTNPQSLARTR